MDSLVSDALLVAVLIQLVLAIALLAFVGQGWFPARARIAKREQELLYRPSGAVLMPVPGLGMRLITPHGPSLDRHIPAGGPVAAAVTYVWIMLAIAAKITSSGNRGSMAMPVSRAKGRLQRWYFNLMAPWCILFRPAARHRSSRYFHQHARAGSARQRRALASRAAPARAEQAGAPEALRDVRADLVALEPRDAEAPTGSTSRSCSQDRRALRGQSRPFRRAIAI